MRVPVALSVGGETVDDVKASLDVCQAVAYRHMPAG